MMISQIIITPSVLESEMPAMRERKRERDMGEKRHVNDIVIDIY